MRQGLLILAALTGLAACNGGARQQQSQGVGFSDFSVFELERARREAELSRSRGTGQERSPIGNAQTEIRNQTQTGAIPSSALQQAGIGQGRSGGLIPDAGAPLSATPALTTNNPGISDEQNFDAVSGRETIESDAQRRARQVAAREQIPVTAVPERPSSTGPNIVEYAINAPNRKGQEWYSRSLLSGQGRFQRNCADYPTPDDAQRDFLARGGPEKDRRGVDPDGDGFACGWDPAPFKR